MLSDFGVSFCNDFKCIGTNIDSQFDILFGHGCVHKMIVVTGDKQSAGHTFGDPFLMQHQAVIIGDSQIEQCRFTGDDQIKAKALAGFFQSVGKLCAEAAEHGGSIQLFQLVDTGDTGGKGLCAHPIGTGKGKGRSSRAEEFFSTGG